MKISLENLIHKNSPDYNGKGKFRWRLAKAFQILGHQIIDNPKLCDINFGQNAIPSSRYGKRVVRIDGVGYSKEAMHLRNAQKGGNKQTRKAINEADGIIYQSIVSKNMCETSLGVTNECYRVIPNGVNPKDFNPKQIIVGGRKNYIMACQFLHPLRRLPDLLRCWDIFVRDKDDAFLYIVYGENIGNVPISKSKNIKILSILKQSRLNDLVHACDATILLTFQDSCPNFAAESLACGTPLIVNNTNGIVEFIDHNHGIVVPVDGTYQFGMQNWKMPPFEQEETLLQALEQIYTEDKLQFDFPDTLNINIVAKQYIDFFEEILQS